MKKLLFATVLGLPMMASAHHSGSMYDFDHCRTLSGTVRALEWHYPHNWLWINVAGSDGKVTAWGLEFMSPTQAHAIDPRWTKDVVKKGDKVSVRFGPMRDGRSGGALAYVTLPDGSQLGATPGLCGGKPR